MTANRRSRLLVAVRVLAGAALTGASGPGSIAAQRALPDLTPKWRWVDFGVETGVPPGAVEELAEQDTIVWVRTEQGVAYYDGFSFVPARVGGHSIEGPATSLAVDSGGRVLIVVGGHLYEGGTHGFSPVPLPAGVEGAVRRAVRLASGEILVLSRVGTQPPGIWIGGAEKLRPVPTPSPPVTDEALWASRRGRIWSNLRTGFHLWEEGGWRPIDPMPPLSRREGVVVDGRSGPVFLYRGGSIFDRTLMEWDGEGRPRPVPAEGANLLVAGDVGPDGRALLVYETGDVRTRDRGRWHSVRMPASRAAGVRAVLISARGDVWLGTNRSLHLYRRSLTRWTFISRAFPDPSNRVNAILVDRDTTMWVGTGGRLLKHKGASGTWLGTVLGTPLRAVTGLARDSTGHVWVTSGAGFEGALIWDGTRWSRLATPGARAPGFIHRPWVDSRGRVWLASLGRRDGSGAGVYRVTEGRLEDLSTTLGLPATRTYSFAEGPDDTFWVGSTAGLYRVHEDRVTRVFPGPGQGLKPGSRIWDMAVDTAGRLWLARDPEGAGGLARLDADGALTDVPMPGEPRVRQVWSVTFTPDGDLWLGTEGGVLRRHDGAWSRFDETTGLDVPNVWPVAMHPEGVLVGTKGGGLAILSREEESNPPPRVRIEPVTPEGGTATIRWTPTAYWGGLKSTAIDTRIRVDGGAWQPWSTRRRAVLQRLGPGRHRVSVQAKGLFGQISDPPATAVFQVPLPLVLRPLFAVPVGLLLVLVLALAERTRSTRARHRRALAESEQRLRTLVEHAPEAIGILDLDTGKFIDVNGNALALLRISREELLSAGPYSFIPEVLPDGTASRDAIRPYVQDALTGGTPVFEWVAKAADGTEIPCELGLARLPAAGRSLLRVSLVDIRERKAAEIRRAELEEQLRQAQKLEAVGQLTGGVAHDFNNLLTVIKGNLELLLEEAVSPEEERKLIEGALRAADRSAELTHRLLAFSRRQTLRPRHIDLKSLISSLVEFLQRSLGETIRLSAHVAEDVWPIYADPVQLENAMINLAVNARDAMPGGGVVRLTVRNVTLDEHQDPRPVSSLPPGRYVVIMVADTGEGMDPAVADRAFDPFFTTKEVGKGSGLGLSMVHGFLRQSGGAATIESMRGEGTVIRLFFPRAEDGVSAQA